MANIFKQIGDFFKMIGKILGQIANIFVQIGKIFIMIFEIIFKISCPISVFTNIHICSYYWFLDMIFFLIWLIVYYICLVFIYIPVVIGCAVSCVFIGMWTGKCWFIRPSDVCPSKEVFLNFIENMWQAVFKKRFLYRDRGDIKKCYCVTALEKLFDPFTRFRNYFGNNVGDKSTDKLRYLIIPIILLGLIYWGNKRINAQNPQ